jgi:hypothetical protein
MLTPVPSIAVDKGRTTAAAATAAAAAVGAATLATSVNFIRHLRLH